MRQAGRYLPEYRKIREKHSFIEMSHTPELAAEVTLLPFKRFSFDAAILFSDILVVFEALGKEIVFEEGKGPRVTSPVKNAADVASLEIKEVKSALDYQAKTIQLLIPELNVPLLGFAGAPFTLASYLIGDLTLAKQWMFDDPKSFEALLDILCDLVIQTLQLQIDAGAKAVQIFDSWAHVLGSRQLEKYSFYYLKKIVDALSVPTLIFARGSSAFAEPLALVGSSGISMDWPVSLPRLRKRVGNRVTLQGNLDPDILFSSPEVVRKETQAMLQGMASDPGYIVNLGHGIKPNTPLESVQAFVDTCHEFS